MAEKFAKYMPFVFKMKLSHPALKLRGQKHQYKPENYPIFYR